MKQNETRFKCHSVGNFEIARNHFKNKVPFRMTLKKNYNLLIIFTFLIPILTFLSCNKLKIENFPAINNPEKTLFLTSNLNYQRNAFSHEELSPPLRLLWEDDYSGLATNGFTCVDSILFFGTGNGYIFAVDNTNGDVIGKKKFGKALPTPPTIYNDILYQTYETGGYGIIAYDLINGEIIWEYENNFSNSSAIVIDNKTIYQTKNGKIICLNYLTGEEIWSHHLNSISENSLAYYDGKIITACVDGLVTALEYTSGIQIWQQKFSDKIYADPVIDNKFVLISTFDGFLIKMDIESGKVIIRKDFNTSIYYAITVDDKYIYIPLSDGLVKVIDKTNFHDIWIFQGEGPAANSALVTDNYVYFPTLGKYLYILDKKTGQLLQEIKLEGRARSIPLIKDGKLVIAHEDKNVNIYTHSE